VRKILKGWWNWITGRNKAIMLKRVSICFKCEKMRGLVCGECGCPVFPKASLIGDFDLGCPLGKWEKITPGHPNARG